MTVTGELLDLDCSLVALHEEMVWAALGLVGYKWLQSADCSVSRAVN